MGHSWVRALLLSRQRIAAPGELWAHGSSRFVPSSRARVVRAPLFRGAHHAAGGRVLCHRDDHATLIAAPTGAVAARTSVATAVRFALSARGTRS